MKEFNMGISAERVAVEWVLKEMTSNFALCRLKHKEKALLSPVGL
ncbi:unnamed protein product [Discosporangium mesarthrocarpum]